MINYAILIIKKFAQVNTFDLNAIPILLLKNII